jgi:Tol biopolymer transport system component
VPSGGGEPRSLLRGTSHVWDRSGTRIYYVNHPRAGGTRIESVNFVTGSGGPSVGASWLVGVSTGALRDLALSADSKRLLATGVEESLNLTRVALSADGGRVAGPEEQLNGGQVRDRYPTVSFDSTRIAFSSNRTGQEELWLLDLRSRNMQRVELPPDRRGWVTQACWSRDDRYLAVARFLDDLTSTHWSVALDGTSTQQLRTAVSVNQGNFACAFAPIGNRFVYSRLIDGFSQLVEFDVDSQRERVLTNSSSDKYEASWSPDGRWLAFTANTGGRVNVWRIAAGGGPEQPLTTGNDRIRHTFYSPDGRWLYVQPNHKNIYRMPADGGPRQQVTTFDESALFLEEPTISPDGRWLVYNRGRGGASLWMLTIATPPADGR